MSAQRALIGINSTAVFMPPWRPRVSSDMGRRIFIGTAAGLWTLEGETSREVETFAGHAVTALAIDADAAWAIIDGSSLWELRERAWRRRAALEGPRATCLAPARNGLLVGTEQAHLLRVTDAGGARIEAFETVEGREDWYTPWGDPADVRSIAVARDGAIHVNVHVGGVARSRDGGTSWTPTIDIEQDVHQVTAHPREPEIVVVASAEGFGMSRNGGDSWSLEPPMAASTARATPARVGSWRSRACRASAASRSAERPQPSTRCARSLASSSAARPSTSRSTSSVSSPASGGGVVGASDAD